VTGSDAVALEGAVRSSLATLKDVDGVVGSFVCTPNGRLVSLWSDSQASSLISALTSSLTATSSKVTRTVSGSTRFCLPPPRMPPIAPCWRLNIHA